MSRLRRLVLSNRFFFITCRVLRRRMPLNESEFEHLVRVIAERRAHLRKSRRVSNLETLRSPHGATCYFFPYTLDAAAPASASSMTG